MIIISLLDYQCGFNITIITTCVPKCVKVNNIAHPSVVIIEINPKIDVVSILPSLQPVFCLNRSV